LYSIDKNLIPGCDLTVISIEIDKQISERLLVASFYKPPEIKFGYKQWRLLFEELSTKANSSRFIILGDFNAQNVNHGARRGATSRVFH